MIASTSPIAAGRTARNFMTFLLAVDERADACAGVVGSDHEDAVVPLPTRQAVIVEEL